MIMLWVRSAHAQMADVNSRCCVSRHTEHSRRKWLTVVKRTKNWNS